MESLHSTNQGDPSPSLVGPTTTFRERSTDQQSALGLYAFAIMQNLPPEIVEAVGLEDLPAEKIQELHRELGRNRDMPTHKGKHDSKGTEHATASTTGAPTEG